jgi:P27 family predicted phage terminase small subunit
MVKLSDEIKLLRNTFDASRANPDPPIIRPGWPIPPRKMRAEALEYWNEICEQLEQGGLLSPMYAVTIRLAAESLLDYENANEALAKYGNTTYQCKTIAGDIATKQYPEVEQKENAEDRIAKYMIQLGLTPTSITRASKAGSGGKKDDTNPFAAVMNK